MDKFITITLNNDRVCVSSNQSSEREPASPGRLRHKRDWLHEQSFDSRRHQVTSKKSLGDGDGLGYTCQNDPFDQLHTENDIKGRKKDISTILDLSLVMNRNSFRSIPSGSTFAEGISRSNDPFHHNTYEQQR